MTRNERIDRIVRSSVPFWRQDANLAAVEQRGGCIASFNGAHYYLTVVHEMAEGQVWSIPIQADFQNNQTLMYHPGPLNYLYKGDLNTGEIEVVDFGHVHIPADIQPRYQLYTPALGETRNVPRIILPLDPTIAPTRRSVYGFSGQNSFSFGNVGWDLDTRLEPALTFVGNQGDIQVYRLNHNHPGHEYYYGCSGSPILDGKGRLVALVVGGNTGDHVIYGVSVQIYAAILALE